MQPNPFPIVACPAAYPARVPVGVPLPSTWDTDTGSRVGYVLGAILLKKNGESKSCALPTSFGRTMGHARRTGGAR
jgi:hypothetical protein